MSYICTVPRLKPLGAATTGVFVSTFVIKWSPFFGMSSLSSPRLFLVAATEILFSLLRSILPANSSASDDKEVESLRKTVEQMKQALHNLKHDLIMENDKSEDKSKTHIPNVELAYIQLLQ
ncbi:hypothetical protein B0H19DRAFT_1071520 [Mycena capillaripes]|nr:hypothetical protein B0H19DRAFT_1071520 [Mycena capillaripes]